MGPDPRILLLRIGLCCILLGSGCRSLSHQHGIDPLSYSKKVPTLKPVVAVAEFENKASFSGQWNLGEGMADLLITRLMDSDKVVVLERQKLNDVVDEIMRQGQELFRKEGRVEKGRLKNAQYLIHGVITDFTVTRDSSGWFGFSSAAARGSRSRARVAMNLKISDVASGEILGSVETEGEVSAGGFGGQVNYKNVSFGGDSFFRTPLGRATEKAIDRAVRKVLRDVPLQFWYPRVAEVVSASEVVINGGKNVRLRLGDEFTVREPSKDVTDPMTGNVIEKMPGRIIGKLRVTTLYDLSAHAALVMGRANRGDYLEPVSQKK